VRRPRRSRRLPVTQETEGSCPSRTAISFRRHPLKEGDLVLIQAMRSRDPLPAPWGCLLVIGNLVFTQVYPSLILGIPTIFFARVSHVDREFPS
jgi:hypothetical protein